MIITTPLAVKAALTGGKRAIKEVIAAKGNNKDLQYIRKLCDLKKIPFSYGKLPEDHHGIMAVTSARKFQDLDELKGDIFLIDGVEDPYNLAYVMRVLYAFDLGHIILRQRDLSQNENQLLRSSAGAFDYCDIRMSDDLLKDLESLKKRGYHLYALNRSDVSTNVFECDFQSPSLYLIGGEKRGINKTLLDLIDTQLDIPYNNDFKPALPTASCVDLLATLIQRKKYQ